MESVMAHQQQQTNQHPIMNGQQPHQQGPMNGGIPQPNQPSQPSMPQATQPVAQPLTAKLCRIGQETVQDIVNKTMELFNHLRQSQLPIGTPQSLQAAEERKAKIQESLAAISHMFRRLREIYEKVNENTSDMEFVQIESLIPLKDSPETGHQRNLDDKKRNTDIVRRLNEEKNKWAKHLEVRNKQLKDMIDMLREIVSDINSMLAMRKP